MSQSRRYGAAYLSTRSRPDVDELPRRACYWSSNVTPLMVKKRDPL